MQFKLEAFLNPYLPAGVSRVDAILTISADGSGVNSTFTKQQTTVGLILDISGSMEGNRILAVKHATRKAIEMLDPSTWFFVVAFSDHPTLVCPLAEASTTNKMVADQQVQRLEARGGTRMSSGLNLARAEFLKNPDSIHYALFLTDGKNHPDDESVLLNVLSQCEGQFQCDCWGVGTDWEPKQLKSVATKLLGNADIIPQPTGIEETFRKAISGAKGKTVGDVRLRLWTPKSAKIVTCKQMSPDIVILTDRGVQVDAQTRDFPTGAWGNETRDYYVAIQLSAGEVGDEMLACRHSIVYADAGQEIKISGPPVAASWTDDEGLSTRINEQVAHYTGQAELAETIQEGLEARAKGDIEVATRMLGRAAKIANESGNTDTVRRLAKVVDIVDVERGTVRLKSQVNKADEMDLDLGSTRTARRKN